MMWDFLPSLVAHAGTNKAASSSTSLNTRKLDEETENLAREYILGLWHLPYSCCLSSELLALVKNRLEKEEPPCSNYGSSNFLRADDRVPTELKKSIMQARMDKKLTQSQLAQMINEKPQIIQEYESGKAIPNQQIIVKLERALGVKLRGKK
ncbi:Multiprotein-bridging factor 1a [Vitis vinifera]|uniref:Multiprotein-bridging factor 1a n=2 Tax=Vitis vinifera TaxID=29760 RepID=A0A438C8N5_VITVI|nr:Multiprotein-bridging factor 1a [Vitis vinifera]